LCSCVGHIIRWSMRCFSCRVKDSCCHPATVYVLSMLQLSLAACLLISLHVEMCQQLYIYEILLLALLVS